MAQTRPLKRSMPLVGAFVVRPRLTIALGIGVAVFVASAFVVSEAWATRFIVAWDIACLVFLAAAVRFLAGTDTRTIRANAAAEDEGQGVILTLAVVAAAVSIAAVGLELSAARQIAGWEKGWRIALAFATVAASWAFVQLIFAVHYAHEYYGPAATLRNPAGYGLDFKGGEAPDYWDFVHFSVVIGVACQTADVDFTSKPMRRIGGVHCVVAFVFNACVLALTINLLAGLFGAPAR